MRKMFFNRGTLVLATAIYQKKCPFTVLSALFLFFGRFPVILDYFLAMTINIQKSAQYIN